MAWKIGVNATARMVERVAAVQLGRAEVRGARCRGPARGVAVRSTGPGWPWGVALGGWRQRTWRGGGTPFGRRTAATVPTGVPRPSWLRPEFRAAAAGAGDVRADVSALEIANERRPTGTSSDQQRRTEFHPSRAAAAQRHRVVAARVPRMAAGDALGAHPAAPQQAVLDDRLLRVARAARLEPAARRHRRTRSGRAG